MLKSDAKVMRKGTRSCRECRRRKIKCTWTSDAASICWECSENNRQCISQGVVSNATVEKRPNLKIRVRKLESIIERLSNSRRGKALEVISETESSATLSTLSNRTAQNSAEPQDQRIHAKSPLFDLFGNDVLQYESTSSTAPDTSATMIFTFELSDREKLLSVVAGEPNILDVLDVAGSWSIAWQDQYPGAKDLQARLTLRDSVKNHMADDDPVAVATGLVCIAVSLQQIRVGVDDNELQLSSTAAQIVQDVTVAVDQLILSDKSYTHSMMGVQLLILKAKQHADSNQLRKSWLRIRQAIQTAQEIDLAKPMPGMSTAEVLGRQKFMGSMFETDRFMSLLLGLPYAFDDNFTDKLATGIIADHPDINTRVRALRRISAIASGHVNDRNASENPTSASVTHSIQQNLTAAAGSLPFSWWNIQNYVVNLSDPMLSHEHLMTQLWFYQTQAFLQLPFMLKAAFDPSFEPSRIMCLNSCRSIIAIFNMLRSSPLLSAYTCKCEDFQGLLGTIVLLVGLLHYTAEGSEPSESSFEADLEMVEITKETFRYARQQQGGNIAKQGLHVLDTLSSFLEDSENGSEVPRKATLFVPYFGTISIQAGASWKPREGLTTSNATVDTGSLDTDEILSFEAAGPPTLDEFIPSHALPSEQDSQWPGDQASAWTSNETVEAIYDWDKILMGAELQQDWDFATG